MGIPIDEHVAKAVKEQREADATTIKNAHVQVLQIIRAEKDSLTPADTAQRIVDFLAQQITENN